MPRNPRPLKRPRGYRVTARSHTGGRALWSRDFAGADALARASECFRRAQGDPLRPLAHVTIDTLYEEER